MKPVWRRRENLAWVETIDSTQIEMCRLIRSGDTSVTVLAAQEQTEGRGRFGRNWHSPLGECLAVSIGLFDYTDWEKPELLGMAIGLAAAQAFDLEIAWPNDLVLNGKKVGGVIAELAKNPIDQLVPVVGVGVNLSVPSFPEEITNTATSLLLEGRNPVHPEEALDLLIDSIVDLPEPTSWEALAPIWAVHDATVGKEYKLADGTIGIAIEIADNGFLVVDTGNKKVTVPSAEAWFGS